MPSLNRFNELLPSQRYVSNYVELPFEEILKIGSMKQGVQDQANLERMSFLGKNWNRLPGDTQRSVELQNELNSKLESFVDKDFNDPNVKSDWYRTKLDIAKQFSPNGEIGAQEANYNLFYKEKDKLDKMLEKGSKDGGIDKGTYDYLLNKAVTDFNSSGGTGKIGPAGFNQVKFDTPATYQDIYKQAQDATQHWKADAISKGGYYDSNGQFIKKSTQEIESIDPNEIIKYVTPALMADPMNQAFAKQQIAIKNYGKNNIDPQSEFEDYYNIFRKPIEAVANELGYTKKKIDEQWQNNPVAQYAAKKALDEKALQNMVNFTINKLPSDPNNPTLTSAAVNANLKSSGNILTNGWELDENGDLQSRHNNTQTKKVVNINGQEYALDNLPKGYELVSEQSSFSGPGNVPQFSQYVKDSKGKTINIQDKQITNKDLFKDMQDLSAYAKRAGFEGNFEDTKKFVANYLKESNTFNMNFTKFDEGTKQALSNIVGVKGKLDDAGELIISDPKELAFSTIKGLNGVEITGKDLSDQKARILNNSKIIGIAQNLTNSNYQAGDMYLQSADGNRYIINTNNKSFNDKLEAPTKLTQSYNKYVSTGEKSINPKDLEVINRIYPGLNVTGVEQDNNKNSYLGYIENGIPKVLVLKTDGTKETIGLDEANRRMSQANLADILPSMNPKNFDRFTKSTQFDTEE